MSGSSMWMVQAPHNAMAAELRSSEPGSSRSTVTGYPRARYVVLLAAMLSLVMLISFRTLDSLAGQSGAVTARAPE
jgi:hypothetical protein